MWELTWAVAEIGSSPMVDVSGLDFSTPDVAFDAVFELVDRWVGPILPGWGYPKEELDLWPLPAPLRRWLAMVGQAPPRPGHALGLSDRVHRVRPPEWRGSEYGNPEFSDLVVFGGSYQIHTWLTEPDRDAPDGVVWGQFDVDGLMRTDHTLKQLLVAIGLENLVDLSSTLPPDPDFDDWWQAQVDANPDPLAIASIPRNTPHHYYVFDDVIGKWSYERNEWTHRAATDARKLAWEELHGPEPYSHVSLEIGPHVGDLPGKWWAMVRRDGSAIVSMQGIDRSGPRAEPSTQAAHAASGSIDFAEFSRLAEEVAENPDFDADPAAAMVRSRKSQQDAAGNRQSLPSIGLHRDTGHAQEITPSAMVKLLTIILEQCELTSEFQERWASNMPVVFS